MYVKHVELKNIRGFSRLSFTLPDVKADGNWIVLLGENGAGKTTVLRSIALALSTQRMAARLVDRPREWLRHPDRDGECEVTLCASPWDEVPEFQPTELAYRIGPNRNPRAPGPEVVVEYLDKDKAEVRMAMKRLFDGVLSGYGAYRRPVSVPRTGRVWDDELFTTLFNDGAGIQNLEEWLGGIDYRAAKSGDSGWHETLDVARHVVRQLMPDDQRYAVEIEPDGVVFSRPGGPKIPLSAMGEGYRVMFALGVDIVRQLADPSGTLVRSGGAQRDLLNTPGVVLIDEVDAHLHPKWQREIGFYLQRVFPKVQFIVATHSPFVAQAASPGGILVLKQNPKGDVELDDSLTTLRGVSATDILQSRAFDMDSVRDLETDTILQEHAELSALRDAGTLPKAKRRRLEELEGLLRDRPVPGEPESDAVAELDRIIQKVRERHD